MYIFQIMKHNYTKIHILITNNPIPQKPYKVQINKIIPWAECKTIASATYDTLAFSVWTLPECKSIVSANFYFLSFSLNLMF